MTVNLTLDLAPIDADPNAPPMTPGGVPLTPFEEFMEQV